MSGQNETNFKQKLSFYDFKPDSHLILRKHWPHNKKENRPLHDSIRDRPYNRFRQSILHNQLQKKHLRPKQQRKTQQINRTHQENILSHQKLPTERQ